MFSIFDANGEIRERGGAYARDIVVERFNVTSRDDATILRATFANYNGAENVEYVEIVIDDATIDALIDARNVARERRDAIEIARVKSARARIDAIDALRETFRNDANDVRARENARSIAKRRESIDDANAYRDDERDALIESIVESSVDFDD